MLQPQSLSLTPPTNLGFWEGVAEWATSSLKADALLHVRANVVAFVSYDHGSSRKHQGDYELHRSLHGQRCPARYCG